MGDSPDILRLGKSRENIKLTYIKENPHDRRSESKPIWKVEEIPEQTRRLMRDLNLQDLGSIIVRERFKDVFSYILANNLTNQEDIEEQRRAIDELKQPDKSKKLDELVDSLYNLDLGRVNAQSMENWWFFEIENQIARRLKVLGDYHRTLTKLEDAFKESNSVVLKPIADYVAELRKSGEVEWLPSTIHRGENHLRLNLEITENIAGDTELRFTRSDYSKRIATFQILKHLGHRFKAFIFSMLPYQIAVNQALVELINHNKKNFDDLASLIPALEFYQGAVKYEKTLEQNGTPIVVKPDFSQDGVLIRELRHPYTSFKGEKTVPNDYDNFGGKTVLLITGANNGGKTFYSKTIGLSQLLLQRGLPISAASAKVGVVDRVYTHFVDQDDPLSGEGRYKFELSRMKDILEGCTPRSLIIIDEPCGGTDPVKGQVQSSYFLEALAETGARTIFNTHFHELADLEGKIPAVRNIHPDTRFSDGELQYQYRMLEGPAGTSYALELAQSMDLGREQLLEKARKVKAMK